MSTGVVEQNRYVRLIGFVSVLVPLAVALLIFMPAKLEAGSWVRFLPHLNAVINSATAILLVLALYSIRAGNVAMHKTFMLGAFALGAVFLVSYIIYHASVPSAVFGDADGNGILSDAERAAIGTARTAYLAVLISHILLSAVVVPLVLMALYFALTNQNLKHRKVVRFAFPIWFYVSVSGVIVYLMIRQFYV